MKRETGGGRWSGSPGTSVETLSANDTETPVLSPPLMGPEVGLAGRRGGGVSLNTAQRDGQGKGRRGRACRGGAGR